MKFSEMNERQKKASINIKYAAIDYIFGLQNGCFDSDPESQEYKDYYSALKDTEGLIEVIYNMATHDIYREGSCYFGGDAQKMIKDIRFCGKEFLMKVVKHFVKKYQSEALEEL